jgi:starch-binding outer membrane protein, SusD/RagB family
MRIARAGLVLLLSVALGGCRGQEVLGLKDLEAINESDVWRDPDLAEAYISRVYAENLPGWSTAEAPISDESPGATNFMYGQLTESSVNYWPYGPIRRINILLADIDKGTLAASQVQRLKAEARFFRAYRYFELVKRYGGVPLLLTPQALTDSLLVERAPTSAVMAQIVADLDSAIAGLPAISASSGQNDGHVHKGTAKALKGRVLLFYASPQFNRNDDPQRWQNAYDANLDAKNYLVSQGFRLHASFERLWFDEMNPEAVFVRRYSYPTSTHNWAASVRPLDESQGTTGGNRPTLEMVNAFPMRDGRPIAGHPLYDTLSIWKNRDPRFYATIAYNGALWELSRKTGRRQWTYVGGESNNPTPSGFYSRKAVNPAEDAFEAFNGDSPWIEIRHAEVLLNLAEAANALGRTDEAYEQLVALRQRAGIEPGTGLYGLDAGMSRSAMQDAIMLERRIELAYENKRFWDLRRNMLFETQLNGARRRGLRITLKVPTASWLAVRDTVNLDVRYRDFFNHQVINLDTQQVINWRSNYYFFAIPPEHLQLNSKLQQTTGWAGGTFDPLK